MTIDSLPVFGILHIGKRNEIMNLKKPSILIGGLITVLAISVVTVFATSKLNTKYDTEFASFFVDNDIQYIHLGVNNEEWQQAQYDGKIAIYPEDGYDFLHNVFLAHAILPKNQQITSEAIDVSTLSQAWDILHLNDDLLALVGQLNDLYSQDISYVVQNSVEVETVQKTEDEVFFNGGTKDVAITYGTVGLSVNPIDIFQGIDRTEFDLIWEELSQQNDDEATLMTTYLSTVINLLIENYTAPVYKDQVDYDVNVLYSNLYGESYTLSSVGENIDHQTEIAYVLFDYSDKY